VLEQAIAFYHVVLTQSKTGAPALEYLHGRGFTDETIERFQLGWAPSGWDQMIKMLQSRRNVAIAELAEVGLTSQRQGGRGAYDKFRSRVIFPIRDAAGNAVGIGGRILPGGVGAGHDAAAAAAGSGAPDAGAPKYLNSPATALFDKSRTLYLIERARGEMRRSEEAVLVEGYTDALMAHQAGFENVVASLGTALTPAQVALIARYAREIVLAYDVDPAGQHAGSIGGAELFRLIGSLAAEETGVEITRVRVARLPEGKDPDEVIRDTPDLWREAIRTAQPIIEFLIDYYATAFRSERPRGGATPLGRWCRCCARSATRSCATAISRRWRVEPGWRSGFCWKLCGRRCRWARLARTGAEARAGSALVRGASPRTPSCRPRIRSTRRPSSSL